MKLVSLLFLSFICILPSICGAAEIKELAGAGADEHRYGSDRIICVDGLKIFQTIAFGYGDGTGAAVSNIQLYEEKNGKVVPVRCETEQTQEKKN